MSELWTYVLYLYIYIPLFLSSIYKFSFFFIEAVYGFFFCIYEQILFSVVIVDAYDIYLGLVYHRSQMHLLGCRIFSVCFYSHSLDVILIYVIQIYLYPHIYFRYIHFLFGLVMVWYSIMFMYICVPICIFRGLGINIGLNKDIQNGFGYFCLFSWRILGLALAQRMWSVWFQNAPTRAWSIRLYIESVQFKTFDPHLSNIHCNLVNFFRIFNEFLQHILFEKTSKVGLNRRVLFRNHMSHNLTNHK